MLKLLKNLTKRLLRRKRLLEGEEKNISTSSVIKVKKKRFKKRRTLATLIIVIPNFIASPKLAYSSEVPSQSTGTNNKAPLEKIVENKRQVLASKNYKNDLQDSKDHHKKMSGKLPSRDLLKVTPKVSSNNFFTTSRNWFMNTFIEFKNVTINQWRGILMNTLMGPPVKPSQNKNNPTDFIFFDNVKKRQMNKNEYSKNFEIFQRMEEARLKLMSPDFDLEESNTIIDKLGNFCFEKGNELLRDLFQIAADNAMRKLQMLVIQSLNSRKESDSPTNSGTYMPTLIKNPKHNLGYKNFTRDLKGNNYSIPAGRPVMRRSTAESVTTETLTVDKRVNGINYSFKIDYEKARDKFYHAKQIGLEAWPSTFNETEFKQIRDEKKLIPQRKYLARTVPLEAVNQFRLAIKKHLLNESTDLILGTHRLSPEVPAYHLFNNETLNDCFFYIDEKTKVGNFVSGWTLDKDQVTNLLKTGNFDKEKN